MRRVTAVLLLAGVLTGCASQPSESPWLVQRDLSAPKRCEPLTADQELVLGVSQEMATAGRRHAALANLERLPNSLPQVRLSKARLLRLLGHGGEAEALYAGLLNTCLVADGHHGLGQLAASRGDNATAQEHLRAAASLSPANDAIRNDLGVVYMNQRQLPEARFELLTAMELNEGAKRAPINLLTLLVYQGDWQTARDLVRSKGLSADEFGRAEERARVMRAGDMRREDVAPIEAAVSVRAVAPAMPLINNFPAGTLPVGGPTRRDAGREASLPQQAQSLQENPGRAAHAVAASRPSYNSEVAGSTAVAAPAVAPAMPLINNSPSRTYPVGGPPRRDAGREASHLQQTQSPPENPGRAAHDYMDVGVRATQDAKADAVAASRPSYNSEQAGSTAVSVRAVAPVPIRTLVDESARVAPVAVPVRTLVAEPAQTAAPMSVSAAARAWALEEAAPAGSAANQTSDAQQQPPAGARPIVCRPSGANGARRSVMECLPNEG